MATRIESGRVQIADRSQVPIAAPDVQPVNFIQSSNVIAKASDTYATVLNRMSERVFQVAGTFAESEAVQYLAENPPDKEQLLIAAGVDPNTGEITNPSNKKAPIPVTDVDRAYARGRAKQVASLLQAEGAGEIAKILTQLDEDGVQTLSSEKISKKIAQLIAGYSAAAERQSPDAAIQVRAYLAAAGHTAIEKARQLEFKAAIEKRFIIIEQRYEDEYKELTDSFSTSPRLAPYKIELFKTTMMNAVNATNDKSVIVEMRQRVNKAVEDAQVNAITKYILTNESLLKKPEELSKNIMTANLGDFSVMMNNLINTNMKAVAQINANVDIALNRRENLKKQQADEDKAKAFKNFMPLYQEAVKLPENNKERKKIVEKIAQISRDNPDVVPLSVIKDLLEPAKAGEGNAAVYFNLRQMIYDNKITDPSQIWALTKKGLSTSNAISALDLFYRTDKQDQKDLDIGISKLAGIAVIPGINITLDQDGQKFQRRQELVAQAKEIEARLIREGKMPTPRAVLAELEDGIAKQRNSEGAKAARKQLNDFWSKQKWIGNTTITRGNLGALKAKAEKEKKMNEYNQIEKLLNQAEGQ